MSTALKNLFGGKPSKSKKAGPTPRALLDDACGRNIPVCVVRPRQAGRVPMARGRLLKLEADRIDIDRVQIPGLDMHFASGDELEAYFSVGRTLYQFKTTLKSICEPKRLNARMVIPGMSIGIPGSISKGDRRNIFRVSVAAQADRPTVSAWRILTPASQMQDDEHEETQELPAMPAKAFNPHDVTLAKVASKLGMLHDFEGWIVDATEQGFGIRLESVRAARFDIFDPLLIRITMPAEADCVADDGNDLHEIDFVAEVRAKREIGDDGCRLGVVLLEENDALGMRRKRTVLRKYLADIQREQLRKSKNRVA